MNNKYQIEIDEFIARFGEYKNARIILYGIGRYTATLLEGVKDFHFVGLMDKDPENIGKRIFGLPVIDQDTAEKSADMIIINTSETYWNVIYNRIQDIGIPVFYKNGKKAEKKEYKKFINPFRELTYSALCLAIKSVDIVSFDFFDTLFMRSVCNPQDILSLLEIETGVSGLSEQRNKAKKEIRENYSLNELYSQIEGMGEISSEFLEKIQSAELELEKEQLVPRWEIISVLRSAQKMKKDIYIISDMYLPLEFYKDILEEYGIYIPAGNILLSNVLDVAKTDGTMWRYYVENIVKNKRALHIGDNYKSDIEEPLKYGLGVYQTPSAWDMLMVSSMKEASSHICCNYDMTIMGCILKVLFQNPYTLERSDGIIRIKTNYDMGYCVFGPVILTFLLWLLQKSEDDRIQKLIFMSRDGYFLKKDFEYICELRRETRECCYLGISRQLAMTASIASKQELTEYISMPYTGNITELFEDRFDIKGIEEIEGAFLNDYVEEYLPEIEKHVLDIQENYLQYIERMELDNTCAVVDLGYYGNNQRYLNKLSRKQMSGYYFNVNLSKQNINAQNQEMVACFQKENDFTGENSNVLKKMIFLESFLTAPYGMVKAVDKNGNFICADKKKNQEFFQDKIEINRGVKQFISDYLKLFGKFKIRPNCEFIDWYYGFCFSGALDFSEDVKKSFYNDNAMMNRIESMLFY